MLPREWQMDAPSILIVEDNEFLARAYRRALRRRVAQARIAVEASRAAGLAALEQARAAGESFDLVILDRSLPDGDGCDLIEPARALSPRPVVTVVTAFLEVDDQGPIIAAGAIPVRKPFSDPAALLGLLGDHEPRSIADVVRLFAQTRGLTVVQERVLAGAASGRRSDDVAADLGLAPATVATHWRNIFDRTGRRSQALVLAELLEFQHALMQSRAATPNDDRL
jgi:DNA-binding NarL/FixJ family response regulator